MRVERTSNRSYDSGVDGASFQVEVWRHPRRLDVTSIAGDFGAIVRTERLPRLLEGIARLGGVVLAAVEEEELRGYATLVPSAALTRERWENLPNTFELGSLEVARAHRGRGVATKLLVTLQTSLPIEDMILFARGFCSHWDLGLTPTDPLAYRRRLLGMLAKLGFQRWDTDDPEVCENRLNFFAMRAGLAVPTASLLAMTERIGLQRGEPWW